MNLSITRKGYTTAQEENTNQPPAAIRPGASYATTQPNAREYKYTTNARNVNQHYTLWGTTYEWLKLPASIVAAKGLLESDGLTDLSNFSTDFDGWLPNGEGSSTGISWTRHTGGTPTTYTGPDGAAAFNYYVYAETSGQYYKDFSLQKDTRTSSTEELACISFYYHMYGAAMGNLYVDVKIGSTWHQLWFIGGEQHTFANTGYSGAKMYNKQHYTGKAIYLSDYDGFIKSPAINKSEITSVRLRYHSGGSDTGDCALDMIALSYNATS